MTGIVVTFTVFILASLLHVFLYKTIGEKTLWGVRLFFTVYLAGFVFLIMIILQTEIPLSLILFYLLSTGIYFILYIGAYLGDESPATRILRIVREKSRISTSDLFKSFSDRELVIKRLYEMKRAGWISEKKNLYFATPRGLAIMKIIGIYQRILRWERSG